MWAAIISAIVGALTMLLPRILLALGIFGLSQAATGQILSQLQTMIFARMSSAPATLVGLTQYIGIWDFIQITIAAYTTALALRATKSALQAASLVGQKAKL
jgi:hypothetical protein